MTLRSALILPAIALLLLCGTAPQAQTLAGTIELPMQVDSAASRISVKVTPGLTQTKKLPTAALRAARKAMIAGGDVSADDLRALADRGDGLAAQKYVRLLLAGGAAEPSDIAYYGSIAVSTGRVWSLPDVVLALRQLDPATEPPARKKAYVAMLYPHAWAGNTLALDAVIDLNGEGKLFGPMSEPTRKRVLQQAEQGGDGRIALRLAMALLQKPDRTADETALLTDYLQRAAASGNLAVSATAANLLARIEAGATEMAATQ